MGIIKAFNGLVLIISPPNGPLPLDKAIQREAHDTWDPTISWQMRIVPTNYDNENTGFRCMNDELSGIDKWSPLGLRGTKILLPRFQ